MLIDPKEFEDGGDGDVPIIPPVIPPVIPPLPAVIPSSSFVDIPIPELQVGVPPKEIDPVREAEKEILDIVGVTVDFATFIGEAIWKSYSNMTNEEKILLLQDIITSLMESEFFKKHQELATLVSEMNANVPLGLAITTEEFATLKQVEEDLRKIFAGGSITHPTSFTDESSRIGVWLHKGGNEDKTMDDLIAWLAWELNTSPTHGTSTNTGYSDLLYDLYVNRYYKGSQWVSLSKSI